MDASQRPQFASHLLQAQRKIERIGRRARRIAMCWTIKRDDAKARRHQWVDERAKIDTAPLPPMHQRYHRASAPGCTHEAVTERKGSRTGQYCRFLGTQRRATWRDELPQCRLSLFFHLGRCR
jgi:hypothetical protein